MENDVVPFLQDNGLGLIVLMQLMGREGERGFRTFGA
jgi:hypothetical protein